MAVSHGVNNVLTVSILLAKKCGSQFGNSRKGTRVIYITQVHHLVGHIESLIASLVIFTNQLGKMHQEEIHVMLEFYINIRRHITVGNYQNKVVKEVI